MLSPSSPVPEYTFSSVTSVAASFNSFDQSFGHSLVRAHVKDLPEGMDASDVRELMSRLQRADIERNLAAATTPQERQDILRRAAVDMARKERLWQIRDKNITQSLRARLAGVFLSFKDKPNFNIQELLLMCNTITSPNKSKVAVYNTNYVSAPYKYMIFFTCLNSSHMYMVADTIYKLFVTHGIIKGKPQTLTVQGKEREAWVLVDLDSIAIHLSFGSHREITGTELPLQEHFVARSNWNTLHPTPINHCNIVLRNPQKTRPTLRNTQVTNNSTPKTIKDDVRESLRTEIRD